MVFSLTHLHRSTLTTRSPKKSKRTWNLPTKTPSRKHSTPSTSSWQETVLLDLSSPNLFNRLSKDKYKSVMMIVNGVLLFYSCLCQNYCAHVQNCHFLYASTSCLCVCVCVCRNIPYWSVCQFFLLWCLLTGVYLLVSWMSFFLYHVMQVIYLHHIIIIIIILNTKTCATVD